MRPGLGRGLVIGIPLSLACWALIIGLVVVACR